MLQSIRGVEFLPGSGADIPDCFVSFASPDAPVLVAIHGISRNAAEIAARFARHPAFAAVTIVAPLFERKRFGKYQQLLARRSREVPSDRALFALLDRLATERGVGRGKFMVFGFSGGAQMAHRLTLLHPDRVSALCAVSAGWYLLPELETSYPYGIGLGCPKTVRGDEFLDIPITVIVGNRDTRVDGAVRQDSKIVERQGANRLRRARMWTRYIADHAIAHGKKSNVTLVTLKNAAHDFSDCTLNASLLDHVATALLV